jgi:exodeoxyribonuclease V beta subunit
MGRELPMTEPSATTSLDLMSEPIGAGLITDLAIEASAGTGKTYSLTALFARLIAENDGVTVDRILLVTFTRNAASALRARVREQLVDVLAELRKSPEDVTHDSPDGATDFPILLRRSLGDDIHQAIRRVESALASLDSAYILTIDAFCAHILRLGGVVVQSADAGPQQEVLVQRVVNDEAVRAAGGVTPDLFREDLYRTVVDAQIKRSAAEPRFESPHPAPVGSGEDAVLRRLSKLVELVKAESSDSIDFDQAKRRAVDALSKGGAVLEALARQFRYLFIDEAQDTDWQQWELFDLLWFAMRADATRVGESAGRIFVGDPKQSIYGFRGADVGSYVHQVDQTRLSGAVRVLNTNYRSDAPILQALNVLLGGTTYGPSTRYAVVGGGAEAARLIGSGSVAVPVTLVELDSICQKSSNGKTKTSYAAPQVVKPAAARVVELLTNSIGVVQDGVARTFQKSDIAVLTHSGSNARAIQRQLLKWNVAAVSNSTSSVAASEAFVAWKWLARALERPSDEGRVRRVLLSPFFGLSGRDPDLRNVDFVGEKQQLVETWRNILLGEGVVALALAILGESAVCRSYLSGRSFLRRLTDFNHVVELVSAVARGRAMSPQALSDALAEIASRDQTDDTAARRVESDDDAVQVMTIHAAKGLEFPVVVVADMWKLPKKRSGPRVVAIDPSDVPQPSDPRTRQWLEAAYANGTNLESGNGPVFDRETFDRYFEKKRLFYVGVTRAEHSLSILTTLPMAESIDLSEKLPANRPLDVLNLAAVDELGPAVVHREDARSLCNRTSAMPETTEAVTPLAVASSHRPIMRTSDRVSYSDLVDGLKGDSDGHRRSFFGELLRQQDEVGGDTDQSEGVIEVDMPLWNLPAGAHVGDAIHKIFEHLDLSADDFDTELRRVIARHASQDFLRSHHDALFVGLRHVCTTPLGPELNGLTLRTADPRLQVAEMRFDVSVSVGVPAESATVQQIGEYLLERLGPDDPLRGYGDQLKSTGGGHLIRGTLNGSIDKIFPVGAGDTVRFFVSDYKSNKIAAPQGARPIDRYTPENLRTVMQDAHYPLQALLYGVALHRYLRWRAPHLDPDAAVGGWSYLFVRGMLGAATTEIDGGVHGVSTWSSQGYPQFWGGLSDVLMGSKR